MWFEKFYHQKQYIATTVTQFICCSTCRFRWKFCVQHVSDLWFMKHAFLVAGTWKFIALCLSSCQLMHIVLFYILWKHVRTINMNPICVSLLLIMLKVLILSVFRMLIFHDFFQITLPIEATQRATNFKFSMLNWNYFKFQFYFAFSNVDKRTHISLCCGANRCPNSPSHRSNVTKFQEVRLI